MNRLLKIETPSVLDGLGLLDGIPGFDSANLNRHAADMHQVVLDGNDRIAGRCSLWWRHVPDHVAGQIGLIGHYAARDAGIGRRLLEHAFRELSANGCTMAVGPMDGSTWRQYRFRTGGDCSPAFFLEPSNPPEWPAQFLDSGFKPLARYYSSVDERLEYDDDSHAHRAADRLAKTGVTLRPLDMAHFSEELAAIHPVITASFQKGFLYQPLSPAEFSAQYEPIRRAVRPELVTIAMHEGRPVGLIFTLPDVLQARAGKSVDTAIVKTLCILPERQYAGLGSHLLAVNRRAVRALGYRRLIHALMHESNESLNLSARYATVFRHYTLFAKSL